MSFIKLSNKQKSEIYKTNFKYWKEDNLKQQKGFFIVFNDFETKNILTKISGNALKLYIFIGIHSNNSTGESWYSIESISKYFNKSPRTISYWLRELEKANLIRRMQLNINQSSHTYLQPY